MKKFFPVLAAAVVLAPVFLTGDPSLPQRLSRPIQDVVKKARLRDKVLIEGKIKKLFDFDTVLLQDDSGELAVSFVGVKQNLNRDDEIAVYGKFDGRNSYVSRYALVKAIAWVPLNSPEADAFRQKYAGPAQPSPVPSPPAPLDRNTESRLKELDELQNKRLISPEEYQEQRHRILNNL